MTTPTLVRDTGGAPVQAVKPTTNATFATSTTSARVAIPTDGVVFRVASNASGFIAFGDSGITASTSSMVFPAGVEVFNLKDTGHTHVAFILGTGSGNFSITSLK